MMMRVMIAQRSISGLFAVWLLLILSSSQYRPSTPFSMPTENIRATQTGARVMSARVEVELDIFSGNPNPTWILAPEEGVLFLQRLTALPPSPAKDLSTHLGYRGFVIQVVQGTEQRLVHIQNGTVQILVNNTKVNYSDRNRDLERWLLNSGKPALKSDLFKMVENELPK
jgi:hypothetical protein